MFPIATGLQRIKCHPKWSHILVTSFMPANTSGSSSRTPMLESFNSPAHNEGIHDPWVPRKSVPLKDKRNVQFPFGQDATCRKNSWLRLHTMNALEKQKNGYLKSKMNSHVNVLYTNWERTCV